VVFTEQDVRSWISEWEGLTLDFKSHKILSEPQKLARLMVAFANNKYISEDFGGRIIIGISDDTRKIEKFVAKQGHEEFVMNIARDKCSPSIRPMFEDVQISNDHVYVITIPKMTHTPHALNTDSGKVHLIRVGSTIREPSADELEQLFKKVDDSKSEGEITKFQNSLPVIPDAIRELLVIPIDSNSRLIEFNQENVDWLRSRQLQYVNIESYGRIVQNEIHYRNSSFPENPHTYGVINDMGYFCLQEKIHEQRLIAAGREVVFLFVILRHIQQLYKHFNYDQRLLIRYTHYKVENFVLGSSNIDDPFHMGKTTQMHQFTITREVSLKSFDPQKLVASIMEELTRAFGEVEDETFFIHYVENIVKKNF